MTNRKILTAAVCFLSLLLFPVAAAFAAPRSLAPLTALEAKKTGATCANIVTLADGAWLTVDGNATVLSRDQGATWVERRPIYTGPGADKPGLIWLVSSQGRFAAQISGVALLSPRSV